MFDGKFLLVEKMDPLFSSFEQAAKMLTPAIIATAMAANIVLAFMALCIKWLNVLY